MTDAPTRIRVHGGRVAHAVTAYPGGRLRTECFYDLGVGDVSCHGHCALPADTAVTCQACLRELARKEVPPRPGGDAQAESEPRPNVDDIARCLSAGDVEINHGDYPAWDDLRDGGRDQYRQLARYLLARYDITPRTARGDQ